MASVSLKNYLYALGAAIAIAGASPALAQSDGGQAPAPDTDSSVVSESADISSQSEIPQAQPPAEEPAENVQESVSDDEAISDISSENSRLYTTATEENPSLYDMRGDEGILREFRPSGLAFLSRDRILVCDENSQQLHIFDIEGRRFRKLDNPRALPQPRYTCLAPLGSDKYLVAGSHFHVQNNVRFLWARGVLHEYELHAERLTDESAGINYDPEMAWRNTGYFGENNKDKRMKLEGMAADKITDTLYFALSQPSNEDETAILYKVPLSQIMDRKKKIKLELLKTDLIPGLDSSINEPFAVTDICHVPDRGLLILVSSKSADERVMGTSQVWFQADGSDTARLIADGIAPGNFGTGISALKMGDGYSVGIVFDNNPSLTDIPSRFMILDDIAI